MLSIFDSKWARTCKGVSGREFIRIGSSGLGLSGLTLPNDLPRKDRANPNLPSVQTSVVMVRYVCITFLICIYLLSVCSPTLAGKKTAKLDPRNAWHGRDKILPKHYVCYQPTKSLRIDGKLNDVSWQAVPWTEDFVDIEGDRKPKPRFRTRVKMLWDETYFYIAAELQEPHVWGTLTKHDSIIYHDNDFEVFLDPDGDNHNYLEYEINALGTGFDLFLPKPYKDGGRAEIPWNIDGLKKAVHIQHTLNNPNDIDKKWTVELAFPWRALGCKAKVTIPPKNGQQWRVNFSRVQWKHKIVDGKYRKVKGSPEDNWVWSPQYAINMHRPETWGYVQFSTSENGKAKFEFDPTESARFVLYRILYAQHAYRKEHKRWAAKLTDLDLGVFKIPPHVGALRLIVKGDRFTVTTKMHLPNRKRLCLTLHQDSRLELSHTGN